MKYFLFGLAFILICVSPSLVKADVTIRVGPAVFHFPGPGQFQYDQGRQYDREYFRRNKRRRQRRRRFRREIDRNHLREQNKFARPRQIPLRSSLPARSIYISTRHRKLYFIRNKNTAIVYPIAVGKVGFAWRGREKVSAIKHWPDWYPPDEMRARKPELPKKVSGGPQNPLGAAAIYLGDTLYRIHGTNEPNKIGTAVSSGCIRMHNAHVLDLIRRIKLGTLVVVR